MEIHLIVACDNNGVIGHEGAIPWHLPPDLQRFKALTMDSPVVMGRATHDAIGRVLPGRLNVVVSRDEHPEKERENLVFLTSFDDVYRVCHNEERVFIIGGSSAYTHFLPLGDYVHLTHVMGDYPGDTTFPHVKGGTLIHDRYDLMKSAIHHYLPPNGTDPIFYAYDTYRAYHDVVPHPWSGGFL